MRMPDIFTMPVSRRVEDKTISNVVKKLNHTEIALMYSRTPVELLDNLYMGDLAKNVLFDFLSEHVSVPLIDYDDVRKDNFENHDPGWDIMAGNRNLKMEVKSSIPTNFELVQDIFNKRDIKVTASPDKGKTWILPENISSDIHVQVYFYAQPYKKGYDSLPQLLSDLSADIGKVRTIINTDKYRQPLFFGFYTKEDIIKHLETLPQDKRTWTFNWTERIYWSCPISKASNMQSLIQYINNN